MSTARDGLRIGDTVRVDVRRRGRPVRVTLVMAGFDQPVVRIVELPNATAGERAVREAWERGSKATRGPRNRCHHQPHVPQAAAVNLTRFAQDGGARPGSLRPGARPVVAKTGFDQS